MNTLVSAPHLTFGGLPTPISAPSSSATPTSSSNVNPKHSSTSKPKLRPLSLLLDSPRSPPSRSSGSPLASPPGTAPASATSTPMARRKPHVKRMSSISYSPRRPVLEGGLGSPAPISAIFTPSTSASGSTHPTPTPAEPATAQDAASRVLNPAALTLAEKHADLLTYIAQKEGRVMELRRQLSEAEKELQGLKKKWEGLVARSQAGLGSVSKGSGGTGGGGLGEVRKIINELVFESPGGGVTSPPPSSASVATVIPPTSTSTSAQGIGLFTPSPTPTGKPMHVQMQPLKKPGLDYSNTNTSTSTGASTRDSISSLSSASSASTSTTTEDSSAGPRSPSPLSTMSSLSSTTAKPLAPGDAQGPTLQALTSTFNRALDGIRTSETYATHSKRASQLFSSGLGQLQGLGFGLGSFSANGPPSTAAVAGGKTVLADYGDGKLTSPTSRRKASSGSLSSISSFARPTSPLSSVPESAQPLLGHASRPSLAALTLGITAQVSQKPALSPIPSPRSGQSVSLMDDDLEGDHPLSAGSGPRSGGMGGVGGMGMGMEVLMPSPAPSAAGALPAAQPLTEEEDEGEAWGW